MTHDAQKTGIICAGSFFWLRASFISSWRSTILPAIPRLLALSGNYSTGCDKAKPGAMEGKFRLVKDEVDKYVI